ncbi:MAG: hypothetical protein M1342_01155 [Patescibacteria group bacterium]|nr:hypothetical protein [Patescibacteria group bacterium]
MKNQTNHQSSNFWFGFAVGSLCAAGAGYFLGTKSGRATTQKMLDLFDNWEDTLQHLLEHHQSQPQDKPSPKPSTISVIEKIRSEINARTTGKNH